MGQGNGVTPAELLKPLKDSWPTYNGDYSGKRYSALTQVNRSNVKHLTLAWMTRVTPGAGDAPAGAGGGRGGAGSAARDYRRRRHRAISRSAAAPSRPPCSRWMAPSTSRCRTTPGPWTRATAANCGITSGRPRAAPTSAIAASAMWNNYLFMETPDDYLVSLDAKTGKERWHKPIADLAQGYFSTPAPIVVGNHVLVGTGNDIDAPGFLQSFDPETGELQWKHLHRPDEEGRSRSGHVGQPGCGAARRRANLDSGRLRSRDEALHLRHRQSHSGIHDRHARRRRQPVHLRAGRA